MKKTLLAVAAITVLSLVPVSGKAFATETVKGTVNVIAARVDALNNTGVYFTVNRVAGDSGLCQRFVVEKAAPNFNTVMSMLLTASTSKGRLDIFAEWRPDHHPVAKDFCTVLEIGMYGS